MLQSKQRTPEEIDAYLEELKTWLKEDRDTPAEEMTDFFSKRLGIYEDVHLGHWPEEYAHIAAERGLPAFSTGGSDGDRPVPGYAGQASADLWGQTF